MALKMVNQEGKGCRWRPDYRRCRHNLVYPRSKIEFLVLEVLVEKPRHQPLYRPLWHLTVRLGVEEEFHPDA